MKDILILAQIGEIFNEQGKIVLAYSGGLISIIILVKENYDAEVARLPQT